MGMKRKARRVKEQGSFLKLQLKGLERSGAFKQPREGGVLAGVQAAGPSGHSFLLNAAAPGPLLLLFQAAVESFPSPESEPGELLLRFISCRLPPLAPGCAWRFDPALLPLRAPGRGILGTHLSPRSRQQPPCCSLCPSLPQNSPLWRMETPICCHVPARQGRPLQQMGAAVVLSAGAEGLLAAPWEGPSPERDGVEAPAGGIQGQSLRKGPIRDHPWGMHEHCGVPTGTAQDLLRGFLRLR